MALARCPHPFMLVSCTELAEKCHLASNCGTHRNILRKTPFSIRNREPPLGRGVPLFPCCRQHSQRIAMPGARPSVSHHNHGLPPSHSISFLASRLLSPEGAALGEPGLATGGLAEDL
jgi:hypothetical protein